MRVHSTPIYVLMLMSKQFTLGFAIAGVLPLLLPCSLGPVHQSPAIRVAILAVSLGLDERVLHLGVRTEWLDDRCEVLM
jgi:hypothetical protein